MADEVSVRITLVRPPKDVDFCLQRGKDERIAKIQSDGNDITFEFKVAIKNNRPDGTPNFLGPFTQGPPAKRFFYINSGTYAGQAESLWGRRAKVHFAGITWAMIEKVMADPNLVLATSVLGTTKDGGPITARVKLLDKGWTVAKAGMTLRGIDLY